MPVLTFIVRVVPVRESLSGGTFQYGGAFLFFSEVIRFIRGTFYAHCVICIWLIVPVPHESRLFIAVDKGIIDKMVPRGTID